MVAPTGFFSNTAAKPELEKTFVNAGGGPFHAAAVAFIDTCKHAPRLNDECLSIILNQFFTHYAAFLPTQAFRTAPERMQTLINSSRKSDMVSYLANVFRHIAINELCANPLAYREVFQDLPAKTTKSTLLQPTFPLPPTALKALAQALGIKISLQIVEPGKEVWASETFVRPNVAVSKFDLVLQLHDKLYFPKVRDKLAHVGQTLIAKEIHAVESGESLAPTIELVKTDNQRLLAVYQQKCRTLLSMVQAKELSTKRLFDLYINFLPDQMSSLSLDTAFFAKLEQQQQNPVDFPMGQDKITKHLVESLASWISLHYVDEEEFFEALADKRGQTIGLR